MDFFLINIVYLGDAPFQKVAFIEGRKEVFGDQDLGNHPLKVQTVTLSGGSSERKDVLSKAWRLTNQAFQNICDLDIDE